MTAEDERRRAFQLAHLSTELAVMSERLADQAMAVADAALALTEHKAPKRAEPELPDAQAGKSERPDGWSER
jgi:hypothetical protein